MIELVKTTYGKCRFTTSMNVVEEADGPNDISVEDFNTALEELNAKATCYRVYVYGLDKFLEIASDDDKTLRWKITC